MTETETRPDHDTRYARGFAALCDVANSDSPTVATSLADIAPDLSRMVVEFGFGDVFTRPGLSRPDRQLATIGALTASGKAQPQLAFHIAGALNVGCTPTEIIEAIIHVSLYAGFPAALNGLAVARETFAAQGVTPGVSEHRTADDQRRAVGLATLDRVDGSAGQQVIDSLADIAPDLGRFLIEFAFGDVYSRPGLDLKTREIVTVAACVALGTARPQLVVHIHGLLNTGGTRTELIEIVMQMAVYAGFPAALNGLSAVREVLDGMGIGDLRATNDATPVECLCGCALTEDDIDHVEASTVPRERSEVGILGTGSAVPSRVVPNTEIAPTAGVDDEWIVRKTGIDERRWVEDGQSTSDLATVAARRALSAAGIQPEQVTLIVVATSTPDQPQPATAVHVQRALSATNACAFDMNSVCSGFMFALATAQSLVLTRGGYALVIGADVYSQILDPTDRRTVVLFGDGAGAAVLGPPRLGDPRLSSVALQTDGELAHLIQVPAGGSRMPASPETLASGLQYFTMDGRSVREFVCGTLPGIIDKFLANASVSRESIHHFIPHQANGVMLGELFDALDLPNAAMHLTVQHYGNTGSASVAITLDDAIRSGRLRRGTSLLAAFGGGMSVGLGLLEW